MKLTNGWNFDPKWDYSEFMHENIGKYEQAFIESNPDKATGFANEITGRVVSYATEKLDLLLADFIKNYKPDWITEEDFATLIEVEYYPLDIDPIDNGFSVNQDFKMGIKRPRGMSDKGFEKYKQILLNS